MKKIAQRILKIAGWQVEGAYGEELRNCVVVVAPHTSQWDFFWGILARAVYGVKAKYLIKDSFFKPGIAWFFRFTGGIPVDRSKKNELTERLKKMLASGKDLKVVFTPEGTRKRVDKWKTGFYWVAVDTGLPIVMQALDYGRKKVLQSAPVWPSGDWECDRPIFREFYKGVVAKHPALFNPDFE
ncbi:MAG: lysophospholipid acyltransferase family protein [Salibacteraceae bacterium]